LDVGAASERTLTLLTEAGAVYPAEGKAAEQLFTAFQGLKPGSVHMRTFCLGLAPCSPIRLRALVHVARTGDAETLAVMLKRGVAVPEAVAHSGDRHAGVMECEVVVEGAGAAEVCGRYVAESVAGVMRYTNGRCVLQSRRMGNGACFWYFSGAAGSAVHDRDYYRCRVPTAEVDDGPPIVGWTLQVCPRGVAPMPCVRLQQQTPLSWESATSLALDAAIRNGHPAAVTCLLAAGVPATSVAQGRGGALHLVAQLSNGARLSAIVKALLAAGCDPTALNAAGEEPLHACCKVEGSGEAVAVLVAVGCSALRPSANGSTPLHVAAAGT
jgi:hypothetical protein